MSALPQLSLKALATVGRSAAVLALIFWISFIEIFIYLAWNPIAPNGINILRSRRAGERRVSCTVDTTAGHGC
jgi:hypothetical protein